MKLRDRVGQTTTTAGSGDYELTGQLLKHLTFGNAGFVDGDEFPYFVERDNLFEANIGVITIPGVGNPTISRARFLKSSTGFPINWPDNSVKNIILDVPAELFGPLGGGLITAAVGGTVNAIALSTNIETPVFADGMVVEFEATGAPTAAVTVALNALAARSVLHKSGDQAGAGSWESGARVRLVADGSLGAWVLASGHRDGSNAGSDIASAATLVKPANARDGSYHRITGATTVANLWTGAPAGIKHEFLVVTGFTITNGANLICPSGANIPAAANDRFRVRHVGSNVWLITSYTKANGKALVETAPPAQAIAQMKYDQLAGPASTAALIPADNTTPQVSEGAQVFSRSFTPTSAANIIQITGFLQLGNSGGAGVEMIVALFKDGAANAIASWSQEMTSNGIAHLSFAFEEAAGSTAARTYSLRYGSASGTTRLNEGAAFNLNNTIVSSMTILERTP